ncbi:hypothetical protein [Embleya sp. NPDC020886]|uniref:hypothetical protein n=1 Tax=Embleya sp. NPDC020886 TaxID=3363980 RepID=UPI0037BB0659
MTVEIDGEHVVRTHWRDSVKDRGDLPELRFSAGQYENETGAPEPNIDGERPTEMVARLFEAAPTGRDDWPARWDCDLDAVRSTPAASRPAANDPELGAAGREPTDLLPPLGLTLTAGDTQAAPDLVPPVSRTTPTASGLVGATRWPPRVGAERRAQPFVRGARPTRAGRAAQHHEQRRPHFEAVCRDHLLSPGADLAGAPLGHVSA